MLYFVNILIIYTKQQNQSHDNLIDKYYCQQLFVKTNMYGNQKQSKSYKVRFNENEDYPHEIIQPFSDDPHQPIIQRRTRKTQQEIKAPFQNEQTRYVRPVPFIHKDQCQFDHVCIQEQCRILQKLCCMECADQIHPNHIVETIEWYFNHEKEKIKRKSGTFMTQMREIDQVISQSRKKRLKNWKWAVKTFKKVETECRAVEEFTRQKIAAGLNYNSRKEAFNKLIQYVKQSNHPKLDYLKRSNPEFEIKQEEKPPSPSSMKQYQTKISEIIDHLYMADDREKIRNRQLRDLVHHHSEQLNNQEYYRSNGINISIKIWVLIKDLAEKCLTRADLASRISISQKYRLVTKKCGYQVLQILRLDSMIITVHPNELRSWRYDSKIFSDFKHITTLQLPNLKYATISEKRQEFILLHNSQDIWSIYAKNNGNINRSFLAPQTDIQFNRILVSECENLLFASGGCQQAGFYICCWSYQTTKFLRMFQHQLSFPHEGDLLQSYTNKHLFRCNKNSIDIFNYVTAKQFTPLQLNNKEKIEISTILTKFQGSDSLCVSTNIGAFYAYGFENKLKQEIYRIIYKCSVGNQNIYHVFYEYQLAEEGFFLAILEAGKTNIKFQDFNGKHYMNKITFEDQVICGRLEYQRDPWRNQLTLILGFESGLIRTIVIKKSPALK
ncbi:hypothetical protein pb186bvf_001892 [Paramecium bursaria]